MARRALGPATLSIVQAVEVALQAGDRHLVVGCSGGPDSLALAAGTRRVADRLGLAARAVVVDHGLQPDSATVAGHAVDQLAALGYRDARVVPVTVAGPGGPEAAARSARYAALAAAAAADHATVLLGHTLDDQAETVLLGLARGSGTRSLAGMAVRHDRWLRPLLGLRRAVTAAACAEMGLTPWSDPHNADPSLARARTRMRVLPVLEAELGPGITEALARTAELCRDDADLLDSLAAAQDPGTDVLRCESLAEMPAALRRRLLRRWLGRHGAGDLGLNHVVAVEQLVLAWRGQSDLHLPGVRVTRHDGVLRCAPARQR